MSPWQVLQLEPNAPIPLARAAWLRGVKKWHPDRSGSGDVIMFLAIQTAWEAIESNNTAIDIPLEGVAGAPIIVEEVDLDTMLLDELLFGQPSSATESAPSESAQKEPAFAGTSAASSPTSSWPPPSASHSSTDNDGTFGHVDECVSVAEDSDDGLSGFERFLGEYNLTSRDVVEMAGPFAAFLVAATLRVLVLSNATWFPNAGVGPLLYLTGFATAVVVAFALFRGAPRWLAGLPAVIVWAEALLVLVLLTAIVAPAVASRRQSASNR